ncbi:MFS transporter [Streptomyces sp. NPDC006365]|uniref:MFS transporter n=1 Tax=Streptomyces sp. NPDC006365 TaxID=3364744 RepID=UPI003685F746
MSAKETVLPTVTPLSTGARTGRIMLIVLLLGEFMTVIDVFIVNVAMPQIESELNASGAALQMVVGGYTIAFAMLLITGARLGDQYGYRRMFLLGAATSPPWTACGIPRGRSAVAFSTDQEK